MGFECVGVALPALLMPTKVTSTRDDLCRAHRLITWGFIVQRDVKFANVKFAKPNNDN